MSTNRYSPTQDTIVHYGEKGDIDVVHGWRRALAHAADADLILCLGTSLKVLKSYPGLWAARRQRNPAARAKLAIVNLQWTPLDDGAELKIAAPVGLQLRMRGRVGT